jgi:glutaryl-CoA dehydrogenase
MVALETARVVRDMMGGNGISLEYQVGRHLTNLESVVTYEGTPDIHTRAIGHELTGMPAYR